MKKIITLLFASLTLLGFNASGQANCNADFTYVVSSATVNFTPVINTDSHYWDFGDGIGSSEISPSHTYLASGNYVIQHVYVKTDSSGTCRNVVMKVIYVQAPCNITADFSIQPDPSATFNIYFWNLTTGAGPSPSASWDFGDGSPVDTTYNPI